MSRQLAPVPPLLTRRFLVVWASSLAYFMAIGTTWPVIPVFVEEELAGGPVAVGVSIGAAGLAATFFRPLIGPVGDRRGRRIILGWGAVAAAVSTLLLIPAGTVAAVVVARVLFGAGEAGAFIGIAAALQDLAPPTRRGEAASYFGVTVYMGLAIGPAIGEALAEAGGAGQAFVFGSVMYLVAGVLGMAAPGAPDPMPPPHAVQWAIHPAARRPGLILFIGLIGYAGFLAFIALHASDVGIEVTGSVFALFAVVVLTVRLVGARIPDRLGALTTTRLALAFSAVGLLILGGWREAVGVYIGTFVMALGQSFLVPALLVLAVDRAPDTERSHAIASVSVGFDLAVGLGGFLVGGVVAATDRGGGFIFCALIAAVALIGSGPLFGAMGAQARESIPPDSTSGLSR
ncbi:MAG: MFS transporter [Actinomycetota bacterium]|nr:MFS transporter [Actinomycetota bacterium]